jgi:hypothetical protein
MYHRNIRGNAEKMIDSEINRIKTEFAGKIPVSIFDMGFSIRTLKALSRAKLWTSGMVNKMTDFELRQCVHGLGDKGIDEINRLIPDRIRTRDGEDEQIEAMRLRSKIEAAIEVVLNFISGSVDFMRSVIDRYSARRAKNYMKIFCRSYPEYADILLDRFESDNDTSCNLYKYLKSQRDEMLDEGAFD